MNYKILTYEEAINYLNSIKDSLSEDIYQFAKERIDTNYHRDDKKMTAKIIHNFITVLELAKQGKYEEADDLSDKFAVENMNIYLKQEGIIQ